MHELSLSLSLPRSLASLSFDLRPDFPYFFVTGFIKIYRHGPRFAWIKRSIRKLERDGKEVTGVTVNVPVNYNTKRSTVAIGLSCRRGFTFKNANFTFCLRTENYRIAAEKNTELGFEGRKHRYFGKIPMICFDRYVRYCKLYRFLFNLLVRVSGF